MRSKSGKKLMLIFSGLILSASVLLSACSLASKSELNRKAPIAQSVNYDFFSTFEVAKGDVFKTETEYLNYARSAGSSLKFKKNNALITNTYVAVGDTVKEGDLLLECGTTELTDKIERLESEVNRYESEVSYYSSMAEIEAKRKKISTAYGRAYDTSKYDEYLSSLELAKNQLAVSQTELDNAMEELDGCRIYADMDGVISYVAKTSDRRRLSNNDTAVTITDQQPYFTCSTKNVRLFKLGEVYDLVYFFAVNTRRGQAEKEIEKETVKVKCISVEPVRENSNTYEIRFTLEEDKDKDFSGDLSASITIIIDEARDVLYVPKTAVIQSEEEAIVYVQKDNGERVIKEVETGVYNTDIIEIKSGLELGETVLTNRNSSEKDQ